MSNTWKVDSLCTCKTTCPVVWTTGIGGETEVVRRLASTFLEEVRWGEGSMERVELIRLLVHGTSSPAYAKPLSCFLEAVIPHPILAALPAQAKPLSQV